MKARKMMCLILSMAMLPYQAAYASAPTHDEEKGQTGRGWIGTATASEAGKEEEISEGIQEGRNGVAVASHPDEGKEDDRRGLDWMDDDADGTDAMEATPSQATPSQATPSQAGRIPDAPDPILMEPETIPSLSMQPRTTNGAIYYYGNWDLDANRDAKRIPKIYPSQADNYLPSLPEDAIRSSLYDTYGPNGCADVQISISPGSGGALNRKEATVNMKPGQLLILRPMGASKQSYAYTSYIDDNKGRRFSDFAKTYHPSDSHYSRLEYAWLMRVTCSMDGDWDAHADGWDTVDNEGDRIYYGPAHWTMHLNVSHDYGPWTTTTEAACTTQGTQKRTCRECGSSQTQSINALGHAFSGGYHMGADDGTYFRRCTRPGCNARTDVKHNPYTVIFDANGGTGNMGSQPMVYQTPAVLQENRYAKDYHTFRGWNSRPDGGGTSYGDGQSVLNLTKVYGDTVTLYAQWLPNTYTITFEDGVDGKQTRHEKLQYTRKLGALPEFTRKGYTFLGFYTEADGGTRVTSDTDVPHEDTAYHARWSANVYRITFHTRDASCLGEGKQSTYDRPIGTLPIPILEDYRFLGWYDQPYGEDYQEGTMYGEAAPLPEKKILEGQTYTMDQDMDVYAYFSLVFRDRGNGSNQRPGKDGILGNGDDNLYLDGPDGKGGTRDDLKVHRGDDGVYGTKDDHHLDEEGRKHFPGPDLMFGTEDDYRDNGDGTNTRPGPDRGFGTADDVIVSNGLDGIPGTSDDWIDNGESYPSTNRRPGDDGIFGTRDDSIWYNGPDALPGTEDDILIHPGLDGAYGTRDDWYDNQDSYPSTNIRPGPDGGFGTGDDEVWFNGPDGLPGNEDDRIVLPGPDGEYGTEDDCYDNGREQEGTNVRPGMDGIFGTKDDELWMDGPDGMPGTEDDGKYVPYHGGGGSGGSHSRGSRATGKKAYRPYSPWLDVMTILPTLEGPEMEPSAALPAIPVPLEEEEMDGVTLIQAHQEEGLPTASPCDAARREEGPVDVGSVGDGKTESRETGTKEVDKGKAVLTAILLLIIILLVLYLIRKVSSHTEKQE
ncbi:InlB B-repeat-containing protein [Enterocloster aldenensis]|uniref:InlB B-repeat-containing protein n=1 Tax=Enterocloster aldenensis TaxID=358742 RepID=UPI0040263700